jgi:hypothetical protein
VTAPDIYPVAAASSRGASYAQALAAVAQALT